jgi:hypothetical protein
LRLVNIRVTIVWLSQEILELDMLFTWNWPSAQATSGPAAPQTVPPTGVQPAAPAPAGDNVGDRELLALATANYSGADPAPAPENQVGAALVAALVGAQTGAPQRAAADASAMLAKLPINIANGAATELNPYKMGAPQ